MIFRPSILILFLIIIVPVLSQRRIRKVKTVHKTIWDDFCIVEKIFKPFAKYYTSRREAAGGAKPIKVRTPGFLHDFTYDETGKNNMLVCVNGLAWLYYSTTTRHLNGGLTTVYDKPELHSFVHHCSVLNGATGPGDIGTKTRELMAILLMGEKKDYRNPSIQLFPAPSRQLIAKAGSPPTIEPKPNGTMINGTSLLLFGDNTECILTKGHTHVELRVRTETPDLDEVAKLMTSDEGYGQTFCKLSYRHVDTNLDLSDPPPPTPEETLNYALMTLAQAPRSELHVKGCYVPDKYDGRSLANIELRIKNMTDTKNGYTGAGGGENGTGNGTASPGGDDNNIYALDKWFGVAGRLDDVDIKNRNDTKTKAPALKKRKDFVPIEQCAAVPLTLEKCVDPTPTLTKTEVCKGHEPLVKCGTLVSKGGNGTCVPCTHAQIQQNIKILSGYIKAEGSRQHAEGQEVASEEEREKNLADYLDERMFYYLMECRQNAFLRHKELEQIDTKVNAKWVEAKADSEKIANAQPPLTGIAYDKAARELAPKISEAESLYLQLQKAVKDTTASFADLVKAFGVAESGNDPKCSDNTNIPQSGLLTIKRDGAKGKVVDSLQKDIWRTTAADPTLFTSDLNSAKVQTCGKLPEPKKTCRDSKPDIDRALKMLKARLNSFDTFGKTAGRRKRDVADTIPTFSKKLKHKRKKRQAAASPTAKEIWKDEDLWRVEVLQGIEDIYADLTEPVLGRKFVVGIRRIMKGYLIDYIEGTTTREISKCDPKKESRLPCNCELRPGIELLVNGDKFCPADDCEVGGSAEDWCKCQGTDSIEQKDADCTVELPAAIPKTPGGGGATAPPCAPPTPAASGKCKCAASTPNAGFEVDKSEECASLVKCATASEGGECACETKLAKATNKELENCPAPADPPTPPTITSPECLPPTAPSKCTCEKPKSSGGNFKFEVENNAECEVAEVCSEAAAGKCACPSLEKVVAGKADCIAGCDEAELAADTACQCGKLTPPKQVANKEECKEPAGTNDCAGASEGQCFCRLLAVPITTDKNECQECPSTEPADGGFSNVRKCICPTEKATQETEEKCDEIKKAAGRRRKRSIAFDFDLGSHHKLSKRRDSEPSKSTTEAPKASIEKPSTTEASDSKSDATTTEATGGSETTTGGTSGSAAESPKEEDDLPGVPKGRSFSTAASSTIGGPPCQCKCAVPNCKLCPTGEPKCKPLPLPKKRPFWDQIIKALKDCSEHKQLLRIKVIADKEDEAKDIYQLQTYKNVDGELVPNYQNISRFVEQADLEYSFNFAIDAMWKIFATVLGSCMPHYEKAIPFVTSKFYAYFTEDFLYPLIKEWTDPSDNMIFKYVLGDIYERKSRRMLDVIMEAAFASDLKWRPPRKLLVNDLSEMNFFVEVPPTWTHSAYGL